VSWRLFAIIIILTIIIVEAKLERVVFKFKTAAANLKQEVNGTVILPPLVFPG
jgi:hypothetical protein